MRKAEKPEEQQAQDRKPVLKIGSCILEDAYTGSGTLLLRAGAKVENSSQLHRLKQPDVRFGPNKIKNIPLAPEEGEESPKVDNSERELDVADFKDRIHRATSIKSQLVKDISGIFERIKTSGKVDVGDTRRIASTLLENMLDDPRALVSLVQLKNVDSYTFTHSVNVSILAIYLALHTEYKDIVQEMGVGALLHDVGKMLIPPSVLNKNGPLNSAERKIMKQHPTLGADLLMLSGNYSELVISCVLDHHEKIDGRGYPNAKKSKDISAYARIISLVDIYDALTTDRPYRTALDPRNALIVMVDQMSKELDPRLLQSLISTVGYFPVGSTVQLNNGSVATVFRNHPTDPLRPAVAITKDMRGKTLNPTRAIDLREEKGVFVEKFVKERTGVEVARELLDDAA